MRYDKYKKRLALILAITMFLGILMGAVAPIVFAEGDPDAPMETGGEEDENEDDEDDEEEEEQEEIETFPPKIINVYPESQNESIWFNQETLHHDIRDSQTRDRFFLKVTFDNTENNLSFDTLTGLTKLRDYTTIYSDSSNISMIDIDFLNDIDNMETDSEDPDNDKRKNFIDKYIFRKDNTNKRAYLYIPIKPLMAHMTYSVTLAQGIVYNGDHQGNYSFTWNFTTMAEPSVVEKDILLQSVIEDYDEMEPIIITGKFFYNSTIEVYFNDVRADKVRIRKDNEDQEYLEVYLPRGRNRLEAGLYDITVENSSNHSKKLYGTLSVVEHSNLRVPVERNEFGTTTPYGFITGNSRMELIRLDHKEPIKEEILRKQLAGYAFGSPIVEVQGSNYNRTNFIIQIPIEQGRYDKYIILRYDEFLRTWVNETNYYVSEVDQRVTLTTSTPGIFVVIESKK